MYIVKNLHYRTYLSVDIERRINCQF